MSSIDERIVILTFDNKQFESNVQTSLGTLDKLKKGLNLEESAKGLNAISASAKSFSLGGIGSAIEDIKGRFSALGIAGMTVVQELTKTFMGLGHKLISAVAGPLTQGGWKRALNIEQANFQMRGLLGETEEGAAKIKDIMGAVQESVMGTAYGADEAARVASQLVATGIEDGQQMLGYLKGVAGAAAMTGGSYDEIGHIFTTVAGQGRLMAQQLNQFAYRGLNVAATLSKQMGITEQEFRELVTDGEISFEIFAAGMEKAFGEHATKANDTFTGSLANMKAALARIGQEVATPSLKNLHDIFISLRHLIDAIHVAIMPFINVLNNLLGSATKNAVSFIDGLTNTLKKATGQITEDQKKVAESTEETAESVEASADAIEDAANRMMAGEFGNGVEHRREQMEALGLSFEMVQNRVNEMMGCEFRYEVATENAADATKDLATETDRFSNKGKKLEQQTKKVVTPMENFSAALANIKKNIVTVGSSIKSAFKDSFSKVSFANGILKVSEAFRSLTENFVFSKEAADGLKTAFKGVFSVFKGAVKVVGTIAGLFLKLVGAVAGVGQKFLTFIGSLDRTNKAFDETSRRGKLIIALGNAVEKVGEIFKAFKEKVKGAIDTLKQTYGFSLLRLTLVDIRERLKEIGGSLIDRVINFFNKIGSFKPNFSWLDSLVTVFNKLSLNVHKFLDSVINGKNPFETMYTSLFDFDSGTILSNVLGFFTKIKDTITGFFSDYIVEPIKNLVMPNADSAYFQKNSFITGIVDFVKSMYEKLKNIDPKDLLSKVKDIAEVILHFVAIYRAIKLMKSAEGLFDSLSTALSNLTSPFKRDKAQKFRDFAIGVGLIVASLWALGKIKAENLYQALGVLGRVVGSLLAFCFAVKTMRIEDAMSTFSKSMIAFGIGLVLLTAGLKTLSLLKNETFVIAAERLKLVALILAAASLIAGKSTFGTLVGMALAIDLLVPALFVLGHMADETITRGAKAVYDIAMTLGLATRLAGRSRFGTLIGMALAVGMSIFSLKALGKMDKDVLEQGAKALLTVMVVLGIATRLANTNKGSAKSLLAFAVIIGVAAVAMAKLGEMDTGKLLGSAISLSGVMLALSKAADMANEAKDGAKVMLLMCFTLAAVFTALWGLSSLNMVSVIASAASLSIVMLAIAKASDIATEAIDGAKAMLIMVVPLAAAAYALYQLSQNNWDSILAAGVALGGVMIAIAAAVKLADGCLKGAIALAIMSVPLIAAAKAISMIAEYDWKNLLSAAIALGATVLALSAAIAVVGLVATVSAKAAIIGAAIILGVILALIGIVALVSNLNTEILSVGVENFGLIGEAIGSFFGSIIAAFGESVSDALPTIGENIASFAEGIKPFIEAARQVDASVLEGIVRLAGALVVITASEVWDGVREFFTGQSSLEEFGSELESFADFFKNFASSVKEVGDDGIDAANKVAKFLDTFKTIDANNLKNLKLGKKGLGGQLEQFSGYLKDFVDSLKDLDTDKAEALSSVISPLADAANSLAGVSLDNFIAFGDSLASLGANLKSFASDTEGLTSESISEVSGAIKELMNVFNESGGTTSGGSLGSMKSAAKEGIQGVIDTFTNAGPEATEAAGQFSSRMAEEIGHNLDMSTPTKDGLDGMVSAFTEYTPQVEGAAGGLTTSITDLFSGMNLSDGVGEQLSGALGEINLFGDDASGAMSTLGIDMSSIFGENLDLSNITSDQMQEMITKLSSGDASTAAGGMGVDMTSIFGENFDLSGASSEEIEKLLGEFGGYTGDASGAAGDLAGKMSEEYGVNLDLGTETQEQVSAMAGALTEGSEEVSTAATALKDSATNALSVDSEKAKEAGTALVTSFVNSLKIGSTQALSAGKNVGLAASGGLGSSNLSSAFYSAGTNAAMGLGNGLSAYMGWVAQKAAELAKRAVDAAKAQLRERSPSRAMMEVGAFAGEGLAIGIIKMGAKVESAGSKIAETAADAIANPLKKIQNLLNEDMDVNPVITPVLDLTNLRSGAGQIGSMFNSNPAFGLAGSYGVMNAAAGFMQMQSSNDDVVEAIKGLSNSNNNSTFNITVDGAENPEDFADRLVRRIKSNSRMR